MTFFGDMNSAFSLIHLFRFSWFFGALVMGCASSEKVLDPVPTDPKPAPISGDSPIVPYSEVGDEAPAGSGLISPKVVELSSRLAQLGYEGVGLEFEAESTIDRLLEVFANPTVERRQIRLVYTGVAHAYDPEHQSLTLAGPDAQSALAFIRSQVPQSGATKAKPAAAKKPRSTKSSPRPKRK